MRFLAAIFCAIALSSAPAVAAEQNWRLTAVEGVVRITPPGQSVRDAVVSEVLALGAVVTTGASSSATLQSGGQRVVMSANSRMKIAEDSTDSMTRILQDLGAVLFQVDKRGSQHFRVETPLLAAVVKGTTFTVTADREGGMVHVAEGLVEVRAFDGGAVVDVPGGQTVRINSGAPSLLVPTAAPATDDARAPVLDYAAASGGLVENPKVVADARPVLAGTQAALDMRSLGAAQSTQASVNVVGIGGEALARLSVATGLDNLVSANVSLGVADLGVSSVGPVLDVGAAIGGGGNLANIGASVGGGSLADVSASIGPSTNVVVDLGGGQLANVSVGAGGLQGGANVPLGGGVPADLGATLGGGAGISANVNVGGITVAVTVPIVPPPVTAPVVGGLGGLLGH